MDPDDPERMHFIDSLWMDLDTGDAPIAVGAVLEFSGRAPAIGRVRQRIAEVMPIAARLRQVPVHSRTGVLQPKWADADPDLSVHVTRETVTSLGAAVSAIMSRPMPDDRPLWDLTLVTGYAAGVGAGLAACTTRSPTARCDAAGGADVGHDSGGRRDAHRLDGRAGAGHATGTRCRNGGRGKLHPPTAR